MPRFALLSCATPACAYESDHAGNYPKVFK
jgi:hypothetical protein